MTTKEQIRLILKEEVQKIIISEENIPKNATYTLPKDYMLNSDSTFGNDLKMPKGTTFTSHYNSETDKSFVSVDRIVPGEYTLADGSQSKKLTYSTVFYCDGSNRGKFWNTSSKSWFIDDKKFLSNVLFKNVCYKAAKDKCSVKNKNKQAQQQQLKNDAELAKQGVYVDAKGNKVIYAKSTDFQKNRNFFISQGLDADGYKQNGITPYSAPHHFNLVALYSMRKLTTIQADRYGWSNTECMRIGIPELKSVNMKSKMFNKYDSKLISLINNTGSTIYAELKTISPYPYANFVLSDFYFQFGRLLQDVNSSKDRNETNYFPQGVYSFMVQYYGNKTNLKQIQGGFLSKPACVSGGMKTKEIVSKMAFASAFIPVIGPFLAAGFGTWEAALAFSEGNKSEAAIGFVLSMIPLAAEIPGLKQVGQSALKSLGAKILEKVPLTPQELEILDVVALNQSPVEKATKSWIERNFKNEAVQHVAKEVKSQGQGWLEKKIGERLGVDKLPLTAKSAQKYIKKKAQKFGAEELVAGYNFLNRPIINKPSVDVNKNYQNQGGTIEKIYNNQYNPFLANKNPNFDPLPQYNKNQLLATNKKPNTPRGRIA